MKFSSETLSILKNFSTINQGIFFKKGSILSTVSPQKNILADVKISEEIPQDFGILDLNNFLSVLSLYKDGAEIEFEPKHAVFKGMGGRSKTRYRFTDPSMIVVAPDKRPTLPTVDVSFTLTEEDLNWITRTANALGSPNIAVKSDGDEVFLNTFDSNDDSTHTNDVLIPNIESQGKKFKLVFKTENLKILPGNYLVEICSKGLAKFTGTTDNNITYYVTLETSSTYA
jgi:hypothetical protein